MSRNYCMAKMFYRFLNEIWLENRMPHNSRVTWQLLLEGRLSFSFMLKLLNQWKKCSVGSLWKTDWTKYLRDFCYTYCRANLFTVFMMWSRYMSYYWHITWMTCIDNTIKQNKNILLFEMEMCGFDLILMYDSCVCHCYRTCERIHLWAH